MELTKDILFSEIFEKRTILICGEKEKMDGHVLDRLLGSFNESGRAVKLAIFFSPSLAAKNYFKQSPLLEGKDYFFKKTARDEDEIKSVNQHIAPLISQGYNLMVCGFDQHPADLLIPLIKEIPFNPPNPYLFFSDRPTNETLTFWGKRNAYVHESSGGLSGLIRSKSSDLIEFSKVEKGFEEDHIMDLRKELIDTHQFFLNQSRKICQIVGLKGMGKKSFVRELIYKNKIKSPLIIELNSELSIEKILLEVFEQLRIPKTTSAIINDRAYFFHRLLNRLKEIKFISLIFFNSECLLDSSDEVQNELFNTFLKKITEANSTIKIYLVSEQELFFKDRSVKSMMLPVDSISPKNILKLVHGIFTHNPMVTISSLKDQKQTKNLYTKIDWLSGGHPQLVRTILERFQPLPFIDLLNNPVHASDIEEEHYNTVSSFLKLNEEETTLLEFLSLFAGSFEYDAIQELHPKPAKILGRVYRKRLILIDLKNGALAHYYIPTFIKKFFVTRMTDDDKKIYEARIARYYKYKSGI